MAIELRGGGMVRFTLVGLLEAPRVIAALMFAGVQVDPQLTAFVLDEDDAPNEEGRTAALAEAGRPGPARRPTVVYQAVTLALVAIAAVLLLRSHEERERDWVAKPVPTPVVAPPVAQVLEQDRILLEMNGVKAEMDRAMKLVQSADPQTRAQGARDFSAAKKRFDDLHGKFEGLPAKYAKTATKAGDAETTE
jgi:hypothetical protein